MQHSVYVNLYSVQHAGVVLLRFVFPLGWRECDR